MIKNSRPIHGSINLNELRSLEIKPEKIIDFSANISPLGAPDYLWEAIQSVELDIYPDPECLEVREAISEYFSSPSQKVPIERIFVGNGSNEIFHLLCRIILSKKSKAFIMTPTYGEYEFACQLAGGSVTNFNANVKRGFKWDFLKAANIIKKKKPSIAIICNPNNPTGTYSEFHEIEALAKASNESGCVLVIDQAYISFVDKPWDSLYFLKYPNIVLARSMSKDYAQTALRIGYAITSPTIVSKLRSIQPDWSVNSLAQKTAIYAFKDKKYLSKVRKVVSNAKIYLKNELNFLGFETVDSNTNFILIKVGNANLFRSLLLKKGIVVRDCSSFGLPNFIRVGIRIVEDCKALVDAIRKINPLVHSNV